MTYAGGSGKQDFDAGRQRHKVHRAAVQGRHIQVHGPPQGEKAGKAARPGFPRVSNIEINDPSIKDFERIARKYGVDYAVKKDRSASPPKYLIFFKGRDADALTAAFSEYTQKKVKKADRSERPSVLAKLAQFKELLKNTVVDRSRRKELER